MGQVRDVDFSRLLGLSIYNLQSQSSCDELPPAFHYTEGEVEAQRKMSQLPKLPQVRYRVINPVPFQSLLCSNRRGWCHVWAVKVTDMGQIPALSTCCVTQASPEPCVCCIYNVEKYKQGDQLLPGRVKF